MTATLTREAPGTPIGRTAEHMRSIYTRLQSDFADFTPSERFRRTFRESAAAGVARRIDAEATVRLLDIGCGHGTWLAELLDFRPDAAPRLDYVGVDVTPVRIEQARAAFRDRCRATFVVAAVEAFRPSAPVDVIWCIEVLAHIARRDHAEWVARFADWLRPGGTLIVIDKDCYTKHALKLAWDNLKHRWLPARLAGRRYYFPEHFAELASTLRYPSFSRLARQARACRLTPHPIRRIDHFSALLADKPMD